MKKPIAWSKLAAIVFSGAMMVGYVIFRTAYAQEGADSRVLPSSTSGRVVPRQERQVQSAYPPAPPYAGPTTTPTITLLPDPQRDLQQPLTSKSFQLAPASTTQISPALLPGSKSAAVIRPSDVNAIFVPSGVPGTPPPTTQPATPSPAPSTQFSLEPQRQQRQRQQR